MIAHRHHDGLIEAIERREGARAESSPGSTRGIAMTNLEIVLRHGRLLRAAARRTRS